jgi:hypothetical protein
VSATPKNRSAQQWVYAKVMDLFGADLRSLATLRIVIAVLVLFDLFNRATDLTAHYTDAGVLPRSVLPQVLSQYSFSLNVMNGGPSSRPCCSPSRRWRRSVCLSAIVRAS